MFHKLEGVAIIWKNRVVDIQQMYSLTSLARN